MKIEWKLLFKIEAPNLISFQMHMAYNYITHTLSKLDFS